MLKGWKTLAFGAAVAVAGVAQQADWAQLVPPQYIGGATALIGAVVVFLRMITTGPVGTKQ